MGYIVNSITQNSEFVPRVAPLLLHGLYKNMNPKDKELHLLSVQLHYMFDDVFNCTEHRSWETFMSRYFLLRLWGHVEVFKWKNNISSENVTTTVHLSQLFNVDNDNCGLHLPMSVGVHQSLTTCIQDSNLESCWSSVEDFQPCTFSTNQPGIDILCKIGNTLVLFKNKCSGLLSTTSLKVSELKDKLIFTTKKKLGKIGWQEGQTAWVAALWRSNIPKMKNILKCVQEAGFGGHVIILNKEALKSCWVQCLIQCQHLICHCMMSCQVDIIVLL